MIPKKIILHHSLTEDSGTVSWGAIRKYHLSLDWSDIGYHAGIELVQSGRELYYEALMGRLWNSPGAHTQGQNHLSLGLCIIGNFDVREPPEGQLIAGAKIVALWMRLFSIDIGDIYRHADFAAKTCPGKMFNMAAFKKIVEDQLKLAGQGFGS